MNAKVTWQKELQFVGMADSGFPVKTGQPFKPRNRRWPGGNGRHCAWQAVRPWM